MNGRRRSPPLTAPLSRVTFAAAGSGKRLKLTRDWLASGNPSPHDLEFVRGVRERDLANARALYGPSIALIAIVIAIFTLSMELKSLLGVILAAMAILIAMLGVCLELHRVMKITDQLAELDAYAIGQIQPQRWRQLTHALGYRRPPS